MMNRPRSKAVRRHNFVQTGYGDMLVAGLLITPFMVINRLLTPIIGAWWSGWLWSIAVLIVSVELVWLLRHVRWLQRILPDLFGGSQLIGGSVNAQKN
nr:hypothetical protein [Lactiplantibacillus plantarum]